MSGSCLISAFGLAVIFAQISGILSTNTVPVVILNGKTPEWTQSVDALQVMSQSSFLEVISNMVGGSQPMVVFSRDNLCVEDLSHAKLQFNDDIRRLYLPSVNSPLSVLENLDSYNISTDEKPEKIADDQLTIVPVENLAVIPEMYDDLLKKTPSLTAIILGASCSYSRSERTRRAATARADTEIIAQADRVLFYSSSGIYLKTADSDDYTDLGVPTSVSSVGNEFDNVRFDMTFNPSNVTDVTLRLQFNATGTKYWYFTSVEYESGATILTLTSNNTIFFPYNFSYHCTQKSVFYNNVTTFLNFTDIQVQIDPTVPVANGTAIFSDGYDCIGFTSIPILSGLFVTAIMALIMIWAMTMIMDIRTMDRFDDPKGKTITIAATD